MQTSELALLGEGMDSRGPPPRFDGTGFQRWKILMQSHLQVKGLNVWRVTSEGTKSNSQQEKLSDEKNKKKLTIKNSLIYTGMFVFSKAAFDHGINTYVYIFL